MLDLVITRLAPAASSGRFLTYIYHAYGGNSPSFIEKVNGCSLQKCLAIAPSLQIFHFSLSKNTAPEKRAC